MADTGAAFESAINTADGPVPLPPLLSPVPRLDAALLPEPLRPWLCDIAERQQVPLEFPTVAAITGLSALIGNKVVAKPKSHDPWVTPANIYGMLVSEPGTGKSPAVKEALRPLHAIEDELSDKFESTAAERKVERDCIEAKKKAIRQQIENAYSPPKTNRSERTLEVRVDIEALKQELTKLESEVEPQQPRVVTSDATVEKIVELVRHNPNGLFIHLDELASLLSSFEKKDRQGDLAFYLTGASGTEPYTVDRIGRGHLRVPRLTLSLFGTIQPSVLSRYVSDLLQRRGDSGWWQRIQMAVYPDVPTTFENINRPPIGTRDASRIYRGLFELDTSSFPRLEDSAGGFAFMTFTDEAQKLFSDWETDTQRKLRGGGFVSSVSSFLKGHISKNIGFVPRLALIFQLVDFVDGADLGSQISIKNTEKAIAWSYFLRPHAERIFGGIAREDLTVAYSILDKLETRALQPTFTSRDIYRKQWGGLTDSRTVSQGLELLSSYGWLHADLVQNPLGGRSKTVYSALLTDRVTKLTKPEVVYGG